MAKASQILVRAEPDRISRWKAAAKTAGVPLSEWIREACETKAIQRGKPLIDVLTEEIETRIIGPGECAAEIMDAPPLVCPKCGSANNILTNKNNIPVKCTACQWTNKANRCNSCRRFWPDPSTTTRPNCHQCAALLKQ